jgi:hypothetical protein
MFIKTRPFSSTTMRIAPTTAPKIVPDPPNRHGDEVPGSAGRSAPAAQIGRKSEV